jgi:hypothetical protein
MLPSAHWICSLVGRRADAGEKFLPVPLTLILLTTTIVAPPSNASKWQMGFNSAFKGLIANATLKRGYGVIVDGPSSYMESDY